MPLPLSVTVNSRESRNLAQPDVYRAVLLQAIQGIGDDVQDNLLHFLGVGMHDDMIVTVKHDLLVAVFSQMSYHVDHALHDFPQVRCRAAECRQSARSPAIAR